MGYREAMEYLEGCRNLGIVPGLESTRELLRRLGHPEKKLKFVHIAGTNGKGSTLSFLSSVLTRAGFRTGRFSSPQIFEYRELFQVDGKMISKAELGRLMEPVKEAAEGMVQDGLAHPTYFELTTALGFCWFLHKKCDIVVLETGMGGLLDATNVIPAPLVAVLASISRDHCAVLGDTLEEIAAQKAGIIKPGSIVVSVRQEPEAMAVVEASCIRCGCPLRVADPGKASGIRYGLERQRLSYGGYKNLTISLAGKYQIDNCVLAVEAVEALRECGFAVSEEDLRAGLLAAQWPGRFQVLSKKPLFVTDGAHNADAAQRLADSIRFYFTNKRIVYIIGILKDKEADRILEATCPLADAFVTVAAPGNGRACPAIELAEQVRHYHKNVTAADSPEEAVEMAQLLAGPEDVIVAFGSLSFQGALIKIVNEGTVRSDSHGR